MLKLFFVDDNFEDYSLYRDLLTDLGELVYFSSAPQFLESADYKKYSFGLVDYYMPGMDGMKLARILNGKVNFCFLSAEEDQKVKENAFLYGAMDYFWKTMPLSEMKLRINNHFKYILRNHRQLHFGNLCFDRTTQKAYINSEDLVLTQTEFNILNYLVINHNRHTPGEIIMDAIWNNINVTPQTLNTHIKNLRTKTLAWNFRIIHQKNQGYLIDTVSK